MLTNRNSNEKVVSIKTIIKSIGKSISATCLTSILLSTSMSLADVESKKVKADLSTFNNDESIWKGTKEESITLMAQPMVAPRPESTHTEKITVQSIHNGEWIVFRIRWSDKLRDEGGKTMEPSDALAIQFPVHEDPLPPIFMGMKDAPVHIFHWRAQYQHDVEFGKKDMKEIYPNMNIDMYPMEFPDAGNLTGLTGEKREQFAHGKAAGNPQSYAKHGVDEIFAEGFSTSAIIENPHSYGKGAWKNGQWTLTLGRLMKREEGSTLTVGTYSHLGFAIWQGSEGEVGSRKSVTMNWTPLNILK